MNKGNFFLLQSCTWSQDALGSALQMVTCWVSGNNAGDKITSNRLCDNLRNELFFVTYCSTLEKQKKTMTEVVVLRLAVVSKCSSVILELL